MSKPAFGAALSLAALWIFMVSLVTGLVLVRQQAAQGPPHPFVSAFVSGLLIGIGCLVVLPEALDQLPDGATSSEYLLLFLSAAVLMFFLDHSVMEHAHVRQGERLSAESSLSAPKDEAYSELDDAVWKAKADDVPAWVGPSSVGVDIEVPPVPTTVPQTMTRDHDDHDEMATKRIDNDQAIARRPPLSEPLQVDTKAALPSHAPVAWCPCHGGDPFAKGGFTISFNPMQTAWKSKGCLKVSKGEHGAPSPPPSPPPSQIYDNKRLAIKSSALQTNDQQLLAEADSPSMPTLNVVQIEATGSWSCQRTCAIGVRVCAWMLHAMVDGMVLDLAPSTYVLLATIVPVTICALQDVAAFTLTMSRLGFRSRRSLNICVVALSCAFPMGALMSHATLQSASSEIVVGRIRTVVAGLFTYMALFELAPPHTHNRAANACYALCFTCGAATAYLVEAVDHIMTDS